MASVWSTGSTLNRAAWAGFNAAPDRAWPACHGPPAAATVWGAGAKKPAQGRLFNIDRRGQPRQSSLEVRVDQLGHLEHRDLGDLEDFLELGIGIDHRALGLVLQVILLDVFPKFFSNF